MNNASKTITFIVLALIMFLLFFPFNVPSDSCEFVWQYVTGNIHDYRSWIFAGTSRVIYNVFGTITSPIILWYIITMAMLLVSLRRLSGWRAWAFLAFLFFPLTCTPFQFVQYGNNTMFAALFLMGASAWAVNKKCPFWFAPAMLALRPNALPLSVLSILFVKRYAKILAVILMVFVLCPPRFVKHIPTRNEFMSLDATRYMTRDFNSVRFNDMYTYGVPHLWEEDRPPFSPNPQGVQDYKRIWRDDPLGMIYVRYKAFSGFFTDIGWIYPHGNARGVVIHPESKKAMKLIELANVEKPFVIWFFSSAWFASLLCVAVVLKHRKVWSLLPMAYFSTFLIATIWQSTQYYFPVILSSVWMLLYQKQKSAERKKEDAK